MEQVMTGGCQCGAVRFRVRRLMDNPHVCHCRMCQKAVGGFFAALVGVEDADLAWTAGEPARFESSEGVDRGFCRDCGTPLFYHRRAGGHVSLTIGSFDEPGAIPLAFEWGVESRLPQIEQLGHLPAYRSTEDSDGAALAAATSRQFPDADPEDYPV